jgi:hypothetical protein
VKLHNVYYVEQRNGLNVQNLVMEICETDLDKVIKKAKVEAKPIPLKTIRNWM